MPERAFPVLTLADPHKGEEAARVSQVRWNNDDRAALPAEDPLQVAEFYAAARKWVEILSRPTGQYWQQLKPGRFLGRFVARGGWAGGARGCGRKAKGPPPEG